MARKKKSKLDIITSYIAKNPDATWSKASEVLASEGISQGYFATQRSKLKAAGELGVSADSAGGDADEASPTQPPQRRGRKPGRKTGAKPGRKPGSKPGRKPGVKPSGRASGGGSDLAAAVEFARKAGGLEQARALLNELEQVQV